MLKGEFCKGGIFRLGVFLEPDIPATCGKCAGRHKAKDCNRNSMEKCVNSSDSLETCMKNASPQLRSLFLSKVNVINGTTQKLKQLSVT